MKLLHLALLGTLTLPVLAQTKAKPVTPPEPTAQATAPKPSPAVPEPSVADLKRALAIQTVKTAIAEAQTAEANIANITAQATAAAKQKEQDALALIASTKKDLGLDDRWEWNFQAQNYVMKPQVGQPPQK